MIFLQAILTFSGLFVMTDPIGLFDVSSWEAEYLSSYSWQVHSGTLLDGMCPEDMAEVDDFCIDRYPWPNESGDGPLLGASAIEEDYIPLHGKTWDCESLCEQKDKRICTVDEWQLACLGTPEEACVAEERKYIAPDWHRVAYRNPTEMRRLDQHLRAEDFPACTSRYGVRMMTTLEEWVSVGEGYAMSRGYWGRKGDCKALNRAHAPNWHDYASTCRCCRSLWQ